MSQLLSNILASSFMGDKGVKGDKGDIGEKGATGDVQAQGAKGDKGDKGEGVKGEPGPVAGSNTQIIFNDSGTASGSDAFTFNKTSNTITVGGNIVPGSNIAYDIGTADKRFKDLFLSNSTIYIGNVSISSNDSTLILPESTVIGTASALSPRIANVQIANSSWSALDDTSLDTAGGYILINGSGFATGINVLIGNTTASSVSRVNSSQLRVQVPALTSGTYSVYASNPDGGLAIGLNALATSNTPLWATGASLTGGVAPYSLAVTLSASEASDTISYSNVGALPSGLTLASNGYLSGTLDPLVDTTYNITVRATDEENQDTDRVFSVLITLPVTFAGTYAGNTVNVGLDSYAMFHTHNIAAGNNLVLSCGIASAACTFGPIGQFATVVAHNKQGNVSWSKSHIVAYDAGYATKSTKFFGLSTPQFLSSHQAAYFSPMRPAAVDSNDNVFIAFSNIDSGANSSMWITKYNSSGNRQWINRLRNNYSNSTPIPTSLSFDNNGDVLVSMFRYSNTQESFYSNTGARPYVNYILVVNSNSGAVISEFDVVGAQVLYDIKNIPGSNNIVLSGSNYGYAFTGVANTRNANSYSNIFARRYANFSVPGDSFNTKSDAASNGAVYSIGVSSSGQYLNILGWNSANLNDNTTYSWRTSFANTGTDRRWIPSSIKFSNNYIYVAAVDAHTTATTNAVSYVIRLNAANGNLDYHRSLVVNSASDPTFIMTGIDVKEDKMYLNATIEEANTADGRAAKGITMVLPSNGYSNSSSTANIQYQVPGIYGNNKIVYKSGGLSVFTSSNTFSYGDACTGLAYISTTSNSLLSNTTANNTYDLLDSSVHYDGDTSGGYYRAAKITNASSNTVMLSF